MNPALLDNPAERRKQVRLRVRPDLQTVEQRYEGKLYYVVKDPVCLRYYRFNRQEHYVFRLFDGEHTLEDVRKKFEDEFRPHRLEFQDLELFARQLVMAGLVQAEHSGAGKHLFERRAKQRRLKRIAALSNVLYWKIPLFDPDRLLTWMHGYLWWIFTWWFFAASVGLMVAAVLHVAIHFQTFYDKLPAYHEFFAFRTVLYLWLSLGVVKVIHEFGHGLSCKAFKGECHEMGVLLMCLSPALYANVTDAWTLADKWKRIIISFAGIYVELVIAALATFVWWYTPHLPVVNNIALSLMVLCSVSTILFNANPLMRFDGYYMLSDWLEIPNLRERARRYLTNSFLEIGLGIETPPEPYMAPGRKVLFITYAITSYIYLWVVMISILWLLSDFLGPQLKVISRMIAVFSFVSMFIWPIYRIVKSIRQRGRLPDMKATRVYVTASLFASVIAAVFLLPLPISRIVDTGLVAINPQYAEPVGLIDPGHLEAIHVREGQKVRKGDALLTFGSRYLQEQREEAFAKWDEQRIVADTLRFDLLYRRPEKPTETEQLQGEWQVAAGEARRYEADVRRWDERLRELKVLRAPRDGVVMGLPKPHEIGKEFDRNYLQNQPVCTVGDLSRLVVKVPVSALDFKLLQEELARHGSRDATVYVSGRTDRLFHGVLTRLPESDAKNVPYALTQRGGGPLAVRQAGNKPDEVVPVAQTYIVEVELTDPDATVRPGALVQAKIHCDWRSAAWWLARKLSQAFDIGLF
jgi:putative peptide zinc metalloprotease protein